eukprot:COSAG04_NODE_2866_length_3451_cov_2.751492_4_plen_80_part_00
MTHVPNVSQNPHGGSRVSRGTLTVVRFEAGLAVGSWGGGGEDKPVDLSYMRARKSGLLSLFKISCAMAATNCGSTARTS